MTAFVLVHGAWSGAWTWKPVRALLWQAGHEAYTPSLSSQSERTQNGNPEVNLTTQIEDVQRLIEYEDLEEVVLVGHSYGVW